MIVWIMIFFLLIYPFFGSFVQLVSVSFGTPLVILLARKYEKWRAKGRG